MKEIKNKPPDWATKYQISCTKAKIRYYKEKLVDGKIIGIKLSDGKHS